MRTGAGEIAGAPGTRLGTVRDRLDRKIRTNVEFRNKSAHDADLGAGDELVRPFNCRRERRDRVPSIILMPSIILNGKKLLLPAKEGSILSMTES